MCLGGRVRLISHRGNLLGPDHEKENSPEYIMDALEAGFDVEVDVWHHDFDGLYLGHDYPKYKIEIDFLKNDSIWCHAKDLRALSTMISNNIKCFWHQKDDYTLTTNNLIWTYPGKRVCEKTIIVCRDLRETRVFRGSSVYGICSDYVGEV